MIDPPESPPARARTPATSPPAAPARSPAPPAEPPLEELRIVSSAAAIREISDPFRRRILEELTRAAFSGIQLARRLDVRPSKVHYAIRGLERVGLIHLVGTRPIRGTTEKYFRAVARSFLSDLRLGPIASWDTTRLARFLGQPLLQQHCADVLHVDTRTLARRIVRDQLDVQPGEIVALHASTDSIELVDALVLEIQLAGAEEELKLQSPKISTGIYNELPLAYAERGGRRQSFLAEAADAAIFLAGAGVWSVDPPHDPTRIRALQRRSWELLQRYEARGVRRLVVTPLLFGNLDWSSRRHLELHDAYWRAILVAGDTLHGEAQRLLAAVAPDSRITLETGGGRHRLELRVDPGHATIADGLCRRPGGPLANLPAGELVLLVEPRSAHGSLRLDVAPCGNASLSGIELEVRAGRVVAARSEEGRQEELEAFLAGIPPGGDELAILGLGLNPEIPADPALASSRLFATPILDKASGVVSVAFGTNRPFGGTRDVPFFWSLIALSPRVSARGRLILTGNRYRHQQRIETP